MTTDAIKQLEQQVDTLLAYCKKLREENTKLKEGNRSITKKLQNIVAQFKISDEQEATGE